MLPLTITNNFPTKIWAQVHLIHLLLQQSLPGMSLETPNRLSYMHFQNLL